MVHQSFKTDKALLFVPQLFALHVDAINHMKKNRQRFSIWTWNPCCYPGTILTYYLRSLQCLALILYKWSTSPLLESVILRLCHPCRKEKPAPFGVSFMMCTACLYLQLISPLKHLSLHRPRIVQEALGGWCTSDWMTHSAANQRGRN